MKDLQALSAQILAKTKEEGQKKIEQYEEVANDRVEEQRQKLVESQKNRQEQIETQMKNDYDREAQTLANNKRNAVLGKKQALLHDVFNKAAEKMANWDNVTFATFLSGVLSQLEQDKQWQIVPGSRSVAVFQSEEVKAILNDYPKISVADEEVKGKGGFIVQEDGIDYNFCFDVLVQEMKKEFSPQLATLAFKN
ncbi:V-type ATPase subunit E [Halolactibacillus miurensis]|uniref:V-type ATPase subunit E n=1 Tax=Halolactibacillus miurensis TaxID=306541 RepID=A0A1I6T2T2_9BACI|nr:MULTISPECIES: ATP synthase subunit E [Halolactibacillus]GEM04980.1 V-type ATPase subunit E [Halolactibacillus miurensis]SFS83584.1 V/A-type H+-transporting ATPase subunit E [Halolactibacillus miurensis]